jgi:hemerythrin-like domain-containing protein
MLRDPSLIPLSRQHHYALALCVRIERSLKAGVTDLEIWQPEIEEHFSQQIRVHFEAEEAVLFPAAERFADLSSLVAELRADHHELRRHFALASARAMSASDLQEFADLLARHIRKEERDLFEQLQTLMTADQLHALGTQLDAALQEAIQSCALPARAPLRS